MADDDGGGGNGGSSPPSCSVGGIYRRKHTLRAIFRSSALVLLVGGYALYHHFGGGSLDGSTALSQRLRSGTVGGTSMTHVRNSVVDIREDGNNFSRLLEEGEGENLFRGGGGEGGGKEEAAPSSQAQEPCPELEIANPTWLAAFYAVGTLYMFLALAIVCDEFFVPALEEISSEHHLNLSMDVAGATLMAAGGSAPELFTSFVGTFRQSDIGIGTIVGSAVFNVLFVIGMCSLLSKDVLTLTWWPLFRDTSYYALGLVVLTILVGVISEGQVHWWEALILLGMYFGYVGLMYFNRKLYKKLTGKELVLPGESEDTAQEEEEETATTNGAAAAETAAAATNGNSNNVAAADGGKGETHSPPSSDDFVDERKKSAGLSQQTSSPPNSPKHSRDHKCGSDFRWPGTFRAGVLKLLLHPESWEQKGGIGIVAKIQGDVDHVFRQVDINGDGSIDKEELGKLFAQLEHEITEEELGAVFRSLDLDGDGTISEEEFSKWYIKSEERILSKVKPIFDTFDTDQSGTIDRNELRELLKTLEPRVTETDVDDAMTAMFKSGSTEEITYEEFADWYVHSIIYTRQQTLIERQIEEEAQGVFEALSPPKGEGIGAWLKYLLVLPLVALLTLTIPDVRRPGYGRWCYVSFILSIAWIGLFSTAMVDWAEILGNTIGIPSVVMGYTVLAAGTSVPDLLSSVIVARMGEGDMAVSSSIGSNIFDILVGLPLPWLIFTLWPTTPRVVLIHAAGIFQSIAILIGMLVAIIAIVHCQGWKMTRTLGGLMFLLYFAFLVQAILTEYYKNPCFG
eukprot:CAMPEP_0172533936 /NCGR_PEP_ID=MMETSP1067-20121228/6479_1 /TAXON_ID=265564 ORGANISM="Thalassiosira punctigera, Strain Tpunct2005C2" /NCGR_SAMPLE_ID=MMETSP1067 /ASSEMBLY_ACC=CAM_ASM_000444 /LENGTH=795 /DNA_ID=CAMNT_0013318657 /DNA_START=411 /DNA_END=2798 /DNA_ORIENTATION=+